MKVYHAICLISLLLAAAIPSLALGEVVYRGECRDGERCPQIELPPQPEKPRK
jgi:hypothetical protein